MRMGPRVIGKKRMLWRSKARSHSRKFSPERSWIVRRPFGKLRGASIGMRVGRISFTRSMISSSLNTTQVSAIRSRNTHRPVGRRGDPARSIPTTTSRVFLAIGVYSPAGFEQGGKSNTFSFSHDRDLACRYFSFRSIAEKYRFLSSSRCGFRCAIEASQLGSIIFSLLLRNTLKISNIFKKA